ncbi:MAG TPA: cytochrome c oxidase subunit II [Candidatus Binataceae bacterium]|nr:cytochrome c oxidase subunit II [Candidatus Binataceae bacterium]
MKIERYEEIFLGLSAVVLILFLNALLYAGLAMNLRVPGVAGMIDPAKVRETPPFDHPGLHQIAPGKYQAVIIGKAWSFTPKTIEIPVGSEVTFLATSVDIDHGFYVDGTRINLMLVPGQISRTTYRFDKPGTHLLLCHEYCGLGHQFMYGKIVVNKTVVK